MPKQLLLTHVEAPDDLLSACTQLEKRIEQNEVVARTLIVQKKKQQALLALKRKKLSENQLINIQAYLVNVEDMVRREHLLEVQLVKTQELIVMSRKADHCCSSSPSAVDC